MNEYIQQIDAALDTIEVNLKQLDLPRDIENSIIRTMNQLFASIINAENDN